MQNNNYKGKQTMDSISTTSENKNKNQIFEKKHTKEEFEELKHLKRLSKLNDEKKSLFNKFKDNFPNVNEKILLITFIKNFWILDLLHQKLNDTTKCYQAWFKAAIYSLKKMGETEIKERLERKEIFYSITREAMNKYFNQNRDKKNESKESSNG